MPARAANASLADDELLITRAFDAPVSLVFGIWATREHMIRWLGPKDFACTHLDLDFRTGGKWRACIEAPDHGQHWMGGEYLEIEKDRRIVMSFAWRDGRDQPGVATRVTVTFEAQGAKTVQRFHQAPFLNVEGRDAHVDGWNQAFDREEAYLERLAAGLTK
jgi:uncharacterized protein YndB with AHSA1/START domain